MYIEIHNALELEQKVLYFKLNNAFSMNSESELNYKIAGVYAIYKDDLCLYVGQSLNIASRIATHLKGKYKEATHIYFWNIENLGFYDFRKRPKQAKESILLNSEKYLMTILKPVENIMIDMDFKLNYDETPEFDEDHYLVDEKEVLNGFYSECTIVIDRNNLLISYYGTETYFYKNLGILLEKKLFKPYENITNEDIKILHKATLDFNNNYSFIAKASK